MVSQRDAADASRDLRFFVRTATPRPCGTAAFADARLPTLFFCIIPNPIEKVKQNYAIFKSKGRCSYSARNGSEWVIPLFLPVSFCVCASRGAPPAVPNRCG